jgi:pyridoxine 5-phosphate synthase
MLDIALRHKPHACCLVPERREELTTEGGLDAAAQHNSLAPYVGKLVEAGIRVSLFVNPDRIQLAVAKAMGAQVVELHAGAFCDAINDGRADDAAAELARLKQAAREGQEMGLEMHAGHGITFESVGPVAAIPELAELNIGHFLIGEAIFGGLDSTIRRMRTLMDQARSAATQIA